MRRTVALTVGAMVAVLACGPAAAGNRPATRADHRTGPRIRPLPAWATGVRWHGRVAPAARDQVLVRFYAAAGEPERRAALDRVRGVIESTLELAGAVVVRLPAGASIEDAVDRLTRVRAVEWAEPNLVRTALQYPVPDDHYYQGPAFPMQRSVVQVQADRAWNNPRLQNARGAATVWVAVVDTGVDYRHEDFFDSATASRILTGPGGTGPALDQGFVVGTRCVWPASGDPMDDEGHGTAVASVIGAATHNGKGLAGVTWLPKLMPVKVMDSSGSGTIADIVCGLAFAKAQGAHVVNMSLGSPFPSFAEGAAIKSLAREGIIMVAASGNSSDAVNYPAAYPDVIAVGSVDEADAWSTFSCFGPEVAVVAPGEAFPGMPLAAPGDAYTTMNGTSFASPMVAGIAAALFSQNRDWAPETIRRRLVQTADKVPPPAAGYDAAGFEPHMGYGRANMDHALGDLSPGGSYVASVYLFDSRTTLSAPSGTDPVARHAMAAGAAGTATFFVMADDLGTYSIISVRVVTTDGAGVSTTVYMTGSYIPTPLTSWTAPVPVNAGFTAAVFTPVAKALDMYGVESSIPLPAYTVPGAVPVSIQAAAAPNPADAGATVAVTVTVRDAGGNPIRAVPVLGKIVAAPGAGAALTPGWGLSGGTPPAFRPAATLSSTPGPHLLVFSVSAAGLEQVTTTLTVTGLPPVYLHKTVSPSGPVCAGSVLTYTLSWSKAGAATVTNLVLTDTLPSGTRVLSPSFGFWAQPDLLGTPRLTASAWAASAGGPWTAGEPPDQAAPPRVLRWTVERLAPGRSGWLRFAVAVSGTLTGGGAVANRASVTVSGDSGVYASEEPVTLVSPPSGLSLWADAPASITAGQVLTLALSVTNTGGGPLVVAPAVAVGPGSGLVATMVGPLPPGPVTLAAGGSETFRWSTTTLGAGFAVMTVSASGAACARAVLTTAIQPPPAPTVTVTMLPTAANTGQDFLVTVAVSNAPGAATGVFSPAALMIGGAGAASPMGGPWPAGALAISGGTTGLFTWTLTGGAAGSLTLSTTVSGYDASTGFTVAPVVAAGSGWIQAPAALAAGPLSASPDPVCRDTPLTVTLTVTNTGGATALLVTGQPGLAVTGPAVLRSSPTPVTALAGGAMTMLTWIYEVEGAGPVSFSGTVTARDANAGTPLLAGPAGSGPVGVIDPGLLQASLAAPAAVVAGQAITVTLTVTNTTGADVTGAAPVLGFGLGAGSATISGGPAPIGPLTIPDGGSQTFAWTVSVLGSAAIELSATLTGLHVGTGCPIRVAAAATFLSGPPAHLVGRLAASPFKTTTGQLVAITLGVSNTGQEDAVLVVPALDLNAGGGLLAYLGGPSPPGPVTIPAGGFASFVWQYTAAGPGVVTFTATAQGTGQISGNPVRTSLSNALWLFAPGAAGCAPVLAWSRSFTGSPAYGVDKVFGLATDSQGNVVLVGNTQLAVGAQDWLIRKYDAAGALLWEATYAGSAGFSDYASAVAVDAWDNVVVAGSAVLSGFTSTWVVRKYAPDGTLQWSRTAGSGVDSAAAGVAVDGAGDALAAGYDDRGFAGGYRNWLLICYGPDGAVRWSRTWDGPGHFPDQANAVAADAAGDWVVAGQTRNDYVEYDNWMIRKYTAGGADAWWDEVVGADHWNDEAHAVAVDGDNNVVVAGNVYSDATYDDWLIRKYRPDGTPAWSVLTDDGHAGTDVPYALAIDGGGNVVAGGHFDGEWIVGKYDATGALRWRDRYVNPAGSSSDARGVAVGPTGRLFSGGSEYRGDLAQGDNWLLRALDERSSCLNATLAILPVQTPVGGWFEAVLTVVNGGTSAVNGTAPDIEINAGGGAVSLIGGPVPAGPVVVPPGGTQAFTWTYSVDGQGRVYFTATANGTDAVSGLPVSGSASAVAQAPRVLFYGPTYGGLEPTTPGIQLTVWDEATWAAKTTADFAEFDAIVFGEYPPCGESDAIWATAIQNRATWSPVVNGNVIVIGTDPNWHDKPLLIHQGVLFAADKPGTTGLYVALGCAYGIGPGQQPVELLGGIGDFEALDSGCSNNVHKVSIHPVLDNVDDTYLENWSCSSHNGFVAWPPEFRPLAIVLDGASVYTACDGTVGMPYIMARGAAPPCGYPDLVKTVTPTGDVAAQSSLTYRIAWTNPGTGTVVNLTLSDTLPAGLIVAAPSLVFWAQPDGLGVPALLSVAWAVSETGTWTPGEPPNGATTPLVLRWTISRIAPGYSGFLEFSAKLDALLPGGTVLTNLATATQIQDSNVYFSPPVSVRLEDAVRLTKTPSAWAVVQGQAATFTLAFHNAGIDTLSNAVLVDTLPAGMTFAGCGGGTTCWLDGSRVVWALANLVPDSTGTVTLTVSITGGAPAVGPNRGVLSFTGPGATAMPPAVSNPVTLYTLAPRVTVHKSADPDPVPLGGTLNYLITVENGGTDTARNIAVWDTLPPGAAYLSCAGGTTCWFDGTRVTFGVPDLPPGHAKNLLITVSVTGAPCPNQAQVVSTNSAGAATAINISNPVCVTLSGPALTLAKVAVPPVIPRGGTVTYALTAFNAGDDAALGVVVWDTLPSGVVYTGCSGGTTCWFDGTGIRWAAPNLEPGATAVLTLTAAVAGATVADNTACATYTNSATLVEPLSCSNAVSVTVTQASLALAKAGSPSPVAVGGALVYTLTVTSTGTDTARQVTVRDTLPAGAIFLGCGGGATCWWDGFAVVWGVPDRPPGSVVTLTVSVTATASLTCSNYATAEFANSATVWQPATVSNAVCIAPVNASLAVAIVPDRTVWFAGEPVRYAIRYTNTGMDPATNVRIADSWPAALSFWSATPAGAAAPGGRVWAVPDLGPGASATIYLSVLPPAAGCALDLWTSTATGLFDNSGGVPQPPVPATDPGVTVLHAGLALALSPALSVVTQGAQLVYTIAYANPCSDTAWAVSIRDTLPPGLGGMTCGGPAGTTCAWTGGTVAWSWGLNGIPPGATGTVSFTVSVTGTGPQLLLPGAAAEFVNGALLPQGTVLSGTAEIDVFAPVMTLRKDAPATQETARPLTFTLTLKNEGNATATQVILTDTLPAGLRYVSATGSPTVAGRIVTWLIGTLAPGVEQAVQVTTAVIDQTNDLELTNTAVVSFAGPPPAGTFQLVPASRSVVLTAPLVIRVFPNPFEPAVAVRGTLKFTGLPAGTRVTIFTLAGSTVRTLEGVRHHALEWDGRTGDGAPVAGGVYLYAIEAPNGRGGTTWYKGKVGVVQ